MANKQEGWRYRAPERPAQRPNASRKVRRPASSAKKATATPSVRQASAQAPRGPQRAQRPASSGGQAPAASSQQQSKRPRKRRSDPLLFGMVALFCVALVALAVFWTKDLLTLPSVPAAGDDVSAASTSGTDSPAQPQGDLGSCVFRSGGDMLPQTIQETLEAWFVTTHNAAARLEAPDLTGLYASTQSGREAQLLDKASVSFISQVRAMQPVDLTVTSFEIGLTVEECAPTDNGGYFVALREDDQMQFACLNGRTSSSCGILNEFTFTADGKIAFHEKSEDGFNLVRDVYQEQSASSMEAAVQQTVDQLVAAARSDLDKLDAQRAEYLADPAAQQSDLSYEMPYDRQAAVDYARQWVGLTAIARNPEWGVYDDYGGNCNNFTSQCLYAGGIPMDVYGYDTQQWKWYSDYLNSYSEARGRSTSWSGVDEFYTYVTENGGYGLVAQPDANLYTAQPGDVIQYGADGEWKHSVLVTEVVLDDDGQPIDFLIASNTTDRIDWPMRAYAYADIRLIQILGYNN